MIPAGALKYVKQMNLETHFVGNFKAKNKILSTIRSLYEHGFYMLMHEQNAV